MNPYLLRFVKDSFNRPGKALDLGAGNYGDVKSLQGLGWKAYGVDLKNGVDLNLVYESPYKPFDLVYSNYLLHKIGNKVRFFKNISHNLKSGGSFFVRYLIDGASSKSEVVKINQIVDRMNLVVLRFSVSRVYDSESGHKHWHQVFTVIGSKRANYQKGGTAVAAKVKSRTIRGKPKPRVVATIGKGSCGICD